MFRVKSQPIELGMKWFMDKFLLKEYGQGDLVAEFWVYREPGETFFKMVRIRFRTYEEFLRHQRQYNQAVEWLNQNPINLDELPKYGLRWIAAHQPRIRVFGKTESGIKVSADILPEAFKKKWHLPDKWEFPKK